MPYALCPMPHAHNYLQKPEKGYSLISRRQPRFDIFANLVYTHPVAIANGKICSS